MAPREALRSGHFFDLNGLWFRKLFEEVEFPWELLRKGCKEAWIEKYIKPNVGQIPREGTMVLKTVKIKIGTGSATVQAGSYIEGDSVQLQEGCLIEAGAWVTGPAILGEGTTIRNGGYVRGGVITGAHVVIGHTSEVKSSIFLNDSKAPHFAYVGDSIIGNKVNLGAGTKVSNLKITNDEIKLRFENEIISTGLRKMGAIIGDHSETGCNSVLNPGVLLGKKCLVYPTTSVRNKYYKPGTIIR